jgi:hypothetical protein
VPTFAHRGVSHGISLNHIRIATSIKSMNCIQYECMYTYISHRIVTALTEGLLKLYKLPCFGLYECACNSYGSLFAHASYLAM